MFDRLETMLERFEKLNQDLMNPEVFNDFNKMKELSKEKNNLEQTVIKYKRYKQLTEDIEAAKEMLEDPTMEEFAKEELVTLEQEKNDIEEQFPIMLLPKDPNDDKNIIMEIRGAAGGDEANIFAGDLFRMYTKYFDSEGWKTEVLNEVEGESGGFSQIEFLVKGDRVYSKLKFESGSHRVQRIPETESSGRVHTSTSTVLVMPEAEEVDIDINMNDIKTDVYRSGGAGGQSVNTTDSAVRMTHLPTGIVVTCQNERSQIKNKEKALTILKTRIFDQRIREQEEKEGNARKVKIGSGDRSEKIRTYNYPQNRITDHRIGYTSMNLDKVMEGHLKDIIEALINEDQKRKLEDNE